MKVTLPGAGGGVTSRLGLGMAVLMREPSLKRRQYVFESAIDVGFRHFDVAPLYGLGTAERELGRLVAQTNALVTIGTKYGLRPSRLGKWLSVMQPPARKLLKAAPQLRSLARRLGGDVESPTFVSSESIRQSLRKSLQELDREYLDLFLMHDVEWSTEWAPTWECLLSRGLTGVGAVGLTGELSTYRKYPRAILGSIPVLQSLTNPGFDVQNEPPTGQFQISHGVLRSSVPQLREKLRADEFRKRLEDALQASVRTPSSMAAVAVASELWLRETSIVLIGSTNSQHVQQIWKDVAGLHEAFAVNQTIILHALTSELESE